MTLTLLSVMFQAPHSSKRSIRMLPQSYLAKSSNAVIENDYKVKTDKLYDFPKKDSVVTQRVIVSSFSASSASTVQIWVLSPPFLPLPINPLLYYTVILRHDIKTCIPGCSATQAGAQNSCSSHPAISSSTVTPPCPLCIHQFCQSSPQRRPPL